MATLTIEGTSDDIVVTGGMVADQFMVDNEEGVFEVGGYTIRGRYVGNWKITVVNEPHDSDYTLTNYLDRDTYSGHQPTPKGVGLSVDSRSVRSAKDR